MSIWVILVAALVLCLVIRPVRVWLFEALVAVAVTIALLVMAALGKDKLE